MALRVIGLDPGLRQTGWGVIESAGSRLSHVANGMISTDASRELGDRLVQLKQGIEEILEAYAPNEAAVEETLANRNPSSTLKLGMARGVALLAPSLAGIPVSEYLPMIVKKAVVGTGHAKKEQVAMMVERLLPGCVIAGADSADALAVAICHAHNRSTRTAWAQGAEDPLAAAVARADAKAAAGGGGGRE